MKRSCPEQVNELVQKLETRGLERLARKIQSLEAIAQKLEQKARGKREGGCGCPQCRKKYQASLERLEDARAEYSDEFNRMYGNHPDQEEITIKWLNSKK